MPRTWTVTFSSPSERELVTGEFVPVDITGAYEYDLIGDLAE